MIDEKKLKETYGLSINEYNTICERIYNLAEFEEKSGLVIDRCNGTLKSTRKFLKKRLDTKKEIKNCMDFFRNHGGFCNCEILFNTLPFLQSMNAEVTIKEEPIK